jgi:hypothetical protein
MMVDPASGQRLYNGPAGSERVVNQGAAAPEGAIDVLTPIGSYQAQSPISQALGQPTGYGTIANAANAIGAAYATYAAVQGQGQGQGQGIQSPAAIPSRTGRRPRRSSSPISSSLQENFRGFSYTAAESVDDLGWDGGLRGRMRVEDETERMREHEDAVVVDEEISISPEEMDSNPMDKMDKMEISGSSLTGEFGAADEAMRKMHIGASRY